MINIFYFTAEWCQPCKKTRPIVEELKRNQNFAGFQIIDVDYAIDLVNKFNIKSVPTFIRFENEIETGRIYGVQTKESLEEFINAVA